MRFGFHVSINGGFYKAAKRAHQLGCQTLQVFSHNPRGWDFSPMGEKDVSLLKDYLKRNAIYPLAVHLSYLHNFCSPYDELYDKSVGSLKKEITRAELLGAEFLVIHLGRTMGEKVEFGINRVTNALNSVSLNGNLKILLENTSGQGSEIGSKFIEIKKILEGVKDKDRTGVCLDTAHAFQAGYDLSDSRGLQETLEEFDSLIGIGRIGLMHLNDSKTPCGSHSDRHWHIGEGMIGKRGMRGVVSHPALQHLPAIMETPRKSDEDDLKNMETIKFLSVLK